MPFARFRGAVAASCLVTFALFGCGAHESPPSRTARAAAPTASLRPTTKAAPPAEPEPKVCDYDRHYEDEPPYVSFEPVEPVVAPSNAASRLDSRFVGSEQASCGDATLVLTNDARETTLTATRGGKSGVVFRGATAFVMVYGCIDLTGDGVPELVFQSSNGTSVSTEVVSLEAKPKTLFKVPFGLELRKTLNGPFPYELVDEDDLVYTEPQLPVVFAYRGGRFERIGSKDVEYWRGRRDLVKRVLECEAKTPGPVSHAFVNPWFVASLYVGDWDDERKSFVIDPVQLLELDLARPALARELDGQARLPALPSNVWLASKGAPVEITKALAALAALPGPPETTEVDESVRSDDASAPLPPGFRFLNIPNGVGTLRERCGGYVVEHLNDSKFVVEVRLNRGDGVTVGRIVPAVSFGRAVAEWCFDLTGDGVPELLVNESSGGAHCCSTYRVISLGATPELLLDFAAADGLIEGPSNVDGKGAYELVGRDDLLLYDASASPFAMTYFVPIVFVLENGKYVRRTRRFTKFLQEEREELVADYREQDPSGMTGDPSGWMALSLLIGDWERVKSRLPIEPSSRDWFDPDATVARIRRRLER